MPIEGVSRQGSLIRVSLTQGSPKLTRLGFGEDRDAAAKAGAPPEGSGSVLSFDTCPRHTATSYPIVVCMWLLHARLRSQFLTQYGGVMQKVPAAKRNSAPFAVICDLAPGLR
jgi:hypothetical protein